MAESGEQRAENPEAESREQRARKQKAARGKPGRQKPTRRQLAFLQFIRGYVARYNRSPTWREMTRAAGAGCPNTATGYVRRLEAKGWLSRKPGTARTVRLTKAGERLAGEES